jgi:transcription elongation factor Elf1
MTEQVPSKDLVLKSCPFCGGAARWCADDEHECHLVVCSVCKISIDFQENPDTETVHELRVIMAEKWNRRAAQPPGDGWDANGSPVSEQ